MMLFISNDYLTDFHVALPQKARSSRAASCGIERSACFRLRFLRISEEVGGKRNAIIIPATGLVDFKRVLDEMVKAANAIPAKSEPAAT